ncbi:MAG: SPASM domain-containing protein [Rhodoplanes sp.]
MLCCSDLYSDVVGDLATERLEEIWTNDLFRHYRTRLDEHDRAGLKLCEDWSSNGGPSPLHYPLREPVTA